MTTATQSAGTSTEFGNDQFRAAAKVYAEHKRVIDAIANGVSKASGGYESFDDCLAQVGKAWGALQNMAENGDGYTPPKDGPFGANNAGLIGRSLTGAATSVSDIRKAFNALGK